MTEFYIDPEDILSDFLRTNLTDPRARAEDTETQTFNPSAASTVITLDAPTTGSVACITGVTIDAVSTNAAKWLNYYWDYQNAKLTFFDAFAGTEVVIVTYKYGSTNWVYSDRPDPKLSTLNFPRISIFTVGGSGKRLGQRTAPVESSPIMQIDIWSKDGYVATISGRKYSNNYLTRYLGNRITRAFENNEADLDPVLYNYIPVGVPRAAPYSIEFQSFHTIVEVNFKGLKLGRREV